MKTSTKWAAVAITAGVIVGMALPAEAQRRGGGGGGGGARASAAARPAAASRPSHASRATSATAGGGRTATSIDRGNRATGAANRTTSSGNRAASVNSGNRTNNAAVNSGNRTVNSNRSANIGSNNNINIDVDNGWDGFDHPIAAGVAIGTTAAITAAAIGSMYYSLPPGCAPYPYRAYTYYSCGGVYYQPQYQGDSVTYVVVEQPG